MMMDSKPEQPHPTASHLKKTLTVDTSLEALYSLRRPNRQVSACEKLSSRYIFSM